MRKRKGQGPIRIAKDLTFRGISSNLIKNTLAQHDDWSQRALEVCLKKYGQPASDPANKAKQMRFLQYRGFDFDQISRVWDGEMF